MPKRNDSDPSQVNTIPHERSEPRPDFSQPTERKPLPAELQQNLDSEERFWAILTSPDSPDSTDSSLRYAAYASRLRTILLSAHRYVAYTSDIGESFRPVAHPWLVRGAYGVSWAYLIGDVAHEGYKSYQHNQQTLAEQREGGAIAKPAVAALDDYRTRMAERAVFQGVASMGLPAFTIHSIVRYSGRAVRNVKNVKVRTWGPIGLGLAAVPALPFMFDYPVEVATEWIFKQAFQTVVGKEAVDGEKIKEL